MAARAILFIALFLLQENVNCIKCYSKYSPYFCGSFMEARDCPGATLRNSIIKDPNIVCCILDSAIIPSIPQNVSVSLQSFIDIVGDTTRTRALYPFYLQALRDAGITERRHIAAFTAQILYQTSEMKFSEESSNGQEYERKKSLGNSKEAEGRKYISRGFLPLIGKHMYQLATLFVNSKIIRQPEIVALPSIGFKVAAWLWTTGYSSADNSSLPTGNLGKFSKGTEYSFLELSINIQQSAAGIETLFHHWRHTQNVIGLECPSDGNGPKCSVDGRSGRCKLVTSCKGEYSATGCPLATSLVTCCLDCQNAIDLAFVLDSSSSVNPSNFQLGLQFIIKVCEYFNIAYPEGTRVALIRYSDVPTIIFRFNAYVNKQDVLYAIRCVPYEPGLTRTDLALLEAHGSLFGNPDNGVRPKGLGVQRVLVLLTEGRASQGTASVVQPSELLHEDGVNIFVIGIGQRLNKNELKIIASDPDDYHVVSSKTLAGVNSLVGNIQESSCYEPALLEEEEEVMSSVVQNSVKYYKYDLLNKTGIKTVFLQTSHGSAGISVSTSKRNPRNYHVNLGSCEFHGDIKRAQDSDPPWQLDDLENSTFCNFTSQGGCTEPRFVSNDEFPEEGLLIYVKACSSRWFYVSVEGVHETNTFNLTLFNDLIRITAKKNTDGVSESNYTTFPIPKKVFLGAAVATVGTTAAVATAVALSCAKEFQLKGSAKIKKKNGKDKDKNNDSAVNEAFEGDDDEKHSSQNRSSLTPLLESGDLKKKNSRSIHISEKKTDVTTGIKKNEKGNDIEKGDGRASHEEILSRGNSSCSSEGRQRKLSRQGSLVTSMIYDLQREDTIIEKTLETETPGSGGTDSLVEGARFKRQVTSTSVSVSVVTSKGVQKEKVPIDADRVRRFGGETMKRNCDMPLTGLGDTENTFKKTKPKRKDAVELNSSKDQNHFLSNDLKAAKGENVKQKDGNTTQNSNRSFSDRKPEKATVCCFQWQPSSSNNKVKKALKTEENSEGTDTEKAETCEGSDNAEENEKVSFLVRMRRKLTKRKVMAAMCPCLTYFILEGEHDRTAFDKEKGESDKNPQGVRDSRFERDMQMSQAFCVLLSQLIFLAGADAKDDTIACAAAAITMNYLSLVTLCWLIVQALYLFSFTRKRESEENQKMKTKLYYAGAWGLPLIVVCVLASKYEMYDKHPHCWISFADALSWSVATFIITLGMVQLVLIVLLAKALITYRKSGDVEENENKRSVIKSGLQTVVCLTITVILTWLLGSLSLNIDLDVYHTFFSIFNALQGFGFFLFYVVLNLELPKLILAAWEWKRTLVTSFDEHEAIKIEEEEEDKDKKKGKGKNKARKNNNQGKNESKQENQQGQAIANTVQTAADIKMTAASIVASNKMRNPENVKALKPEIKKDTRKSSFPGMKANSKSRPLPPVEKQKKNVPSSKRAVPRRKITPQGPPQKFIEDLALKRNAADTSTAPKDKSLRSPSTYAQKPRSPSWSKTIQFEYKDNLPVAAFSPPPSVRTKLPHQTVVPNTTRKNQKLVGKKKTTKGKKVSKP